MFQEDIVQVRKIVQEELDKRFPPAKTEKKEELTPTPPVVSKEVPKVVAPGKSII